MEMPCTVLKIVPQCTNTIICVNFKQTNLLTSQKIYNHLGEIQQSHKSSDLCTQLKLQPVKQ